MKVRLLYAETFKPHAAKVRDELKPILPHVAHLPFEVHQAYVTRAGKCTVDGVAMEFQDLRVYLKVKE